LVGAISVDAQSLAWVGTQCDRLAGAAVSGAPPVSGGFSATAAAVQALHGDVDSAARRITSRLRSTGDKVSTAGDEFAVAEAANENVLFEI
jgi:hypothetical protein